MLNAKGEVLLRRQGQQPEEARRRLCETRRTISYRIARNDLRNDGDDLHFHGFGKPKRSLLEVNLIKRLKPRYNVSLPRRQELPQTSCCAAITAFPQVLKHRGRQIAGWGTYFGPLSRRPGQ